MQAFDLSPLFRTSVGFDRLNRLVDEMRNWDSAPSFPPYDIARMGDDAYRISMAVAGFREQDLDVTVKNNVLAVSGRIANGKAGDEARYLHRGIAARAFERRFQLADHIEVTGARLEHGLLHVDLVRVVPEEMKPRKIAIGGGGPAAAIKGSKAA